MRIARVSKQERERRTLEVAQLLGLEEYLERKPGQLSGGQRQRVAMGRAIIREPSVFLMDEPLSNLDAKLRVQMRAEIAALQSRLGTTTVYVTHDQSEAMTLGDRVAVLGDGRLQQCDAPRVLYDRPANVFVAGFIGSPAMNLCTSTASNGSVSLGGVGFPVPAGRQGNLVVGLRPESFDLAGDGIPAEVEVVEEIGADSYVFAARRRRQARRPRRDKACARAGRADLAPSARRRGASVRPGDGRTALRLTSTMALTPPRVKPRLRGVFHEIAFFVAIGAGVVLVATAEAGRARLSAAVFAACVAACFGFSALYHRPTWQPRARSWLARLDHAGIYLLIAGTYTPFGLLVLSHDWAVVVLSIVWTGAGAAILLKLFWPATPKKLSAAIGLTLGWVAVIAFTPVPEAARRWRSC